MDGNGSKRGNHHARAAEVETKRTPRNGWKFDRETSVMNWEYKSTVPDWTNYCSVLTDDERDSAQKISTDILHQYGCDHVQLLESIPKDPDNSYVSMAVLAILLSNHHGPWPVLHLQRTYTALWKLLPEDAKSGQASLKELSFLESVLKQCKQSYSSLLDVFPRSSSAPAIIDPASGCSIHHQDLATVMDQFRLPLRTGDQHVVAISLPNGPLLALVVLASASYYAAAPVAHGSGVGPEQFKSDVLQSKASLVVASSADVNRLKLQDPWLAEAGISVILANLSKKMDLELTTMDGLPIPFSSPAPKLNGADDTGLLIFTSGTSGTKKLVPLSVHSMVCGVAMVVDSWGLTPSMRCLNQMPLNHVGGLIRNLFSPLISGGSIICCSAFDANMFWDCVEDYSPTWYYASPSMHQCILDASSDHYTLDRPGTSGISVGPEITILDGNDRPVEAGTVGRISIRGSPIFGGYLGVDGSVNASCFNEHGWFDTGDMGYLDTDGYLYITGRSKEVINRGGELISPFEVEEAIVTAAANPASPTYGRIQESLAFSVPHDILQEVVGVVVVTPENSKRASLKDIQESVKNVLSNIKVPVLVVYMNGGLPKNNNKILRIGFAERLCLLELTDNASPAKRHFEADCPPPNTPLNIKMNCWEVETTHDALLESCRQILPASLECRVRVDAAGFYPRLFVAPCERLVTDRVSTSRLMKILRTFLDGYNIPTKIVQFNEPFPSHEDAALDCKGAAMPWKVAPIHEISRKAMSSIEGSIAVEFGHVLSIPLEEISTTSDFFELGGTSMAAGQLLSRLRKAFQVRLPIDVLFANSKVDVLANLVEEKLGHTMQSATLSQTTTFEDELLPGCKKAYSSGNPFLMFLQLLPIALIFPMKRALTWTVFIYFLAFTQSWWTERYLLGRLLHLVLSLSVGKLATRTVTPVLGILFKWLVIGRYREGLHPMWGFYHTRWWLVEKVLAISGRGVFGLFNWSRVFYCRCLGASIGKNVTLDAAVLGEYDLITIGDDTVLDHCSVRPFAAERNTSMYLGRIVIGSRASVGRASIVAAGTTVPDDTCIGPNSSSWEVADADERNRNLTGRNIPKAHWTLKLLLGVPIHLMVRFVGMFPWLTALVGLVQHAADTDIKYSVFRVIIWLSSPPRVALHYVALAANSAIGPVFFFFSVWTVKVTLDLICGPLKPTREASRSQVNNFRMEILRSLMPSVQFHKLIGLFGTHYEATSVFARMMGAKVGKRVYWPGTGPTIQDFPLLDIGNDVVFGSRSHLITSDGNGSDYIRIKQGAMVADRAVLLPGVELGEKIVLGSGALTRRNTHYPAESTWVGSKKGDAVCLTTDVSAPKSLESGHLSEPYNKLEASPQVRAWNSEASRSTNFAKEYSDSDRSSTSERDMDLEKQPVVFETLTKGSDRDGIDSIDTASLSPFGRAFYQNEASYHVWGQAIVFCYSTCITVLNNVYWNIANISALQVVGLLIRSDHWLVHSALGTFWWGPFALYTFFLTNVVAVSALQVTLVIVLLITTKWALFGRRTPGNYDWDKSSYCQRWQLFLKLETFRRHCFGDHGILGLLTGTKWIVWYFQALGMKSGKDCALFASGEPSLMLTEPDMLTLGDRVVVDDASLVAHINTRGNFDLNALYVGDRSVLRSGSRLLSGAHMEADSCLLEHTLIMAGDIVDARSTAQGWPAEEFRGDRTPTIRK
ncbi:hypothetical protein N0V90_007917 [Kalmusia sp. IMI 367209]|nr:hypothetical protein N0V90_007917 [Kalmusia sp. IMI 367209]